MTSAAVGPNRVLVGGALLAMALGLGVRAFFLRDVVDDAFIAFRYAENLAAGRGLVFNLDERVEGYTDFLWVALLALLQWLGIDTPTLAQVLGVLAAVAVIPTTWWVALRCFDLPPGAALLPAASVAASASVAVWAGAGLETPLYMTLFTLALGLAVQALRTGKGGAVAGAVFALAALTRPEAAGLLVVLLLVSVFAGLHRRAALAISAGFAVLFLPHLAFRLAYYGDLLPNTLYAKAPAGLESVRAGLSYVGAFVLTHGLAWGAVLLSGLFIGARPRRWLLAPGAVLAAAGGYVVLVGGDFYCHWRFCVPYLPWLAIAVCAGAWTLAARVGKAEFARAALGAAAALSLSIPGASWAARSEATALASQVASGPLFERYGRWLKQRFPAGTVIATSALGRLPYYAELPTIDMLGLADEHIARRGHIGKGTAGHQRFDSAYVLRKDPTLVIFEFGSFYTAFDPGADVNTQLIAETIAAAPNWPAVTDLVGNHSFRRRYAPRAADLGEGAWTFFFERDSTLERLEAAADASPGDPKANFQLAMQYRVQGLWPEAFGSMEKVIALDPQNPEPVLTLGFFYTEARRFEVAVELLRQFQSRNPGEPRVHFGLGLALQRLGRFDDAIVEWEQFLAMQPDSPSAPGARQMLVEARNRAAAP